MLDKFIGVLRGVPRFTFRLAPAITLFFLILFDRCPPMFLEALLFEKSIMFLLLNFAFMAVKY